MEVAFKVRMRKIFLIGFLVIFFLLSRDSYASSDLVNQNASSALVNQNASSAYVLPYPSSMPGSFLYRPRLLFEALSKYWYFGNFGQFEYNLKESDKYLVEAKILFEYGQYLHALTVSLKASDSYFIKTLPFLINAENEGKDISINRKVLKNAAGKHIEILEKLINELPDKFEWKPEKDKPTTLYIKKDIEQSISIRKKYL